MRVAVFSDIHANLAALEAVLADLEVVQPDQVIIGGDMVNRGPDNDRVLQRILELDAVLLLGNHDDLLRMWVDRDLSLPSTWFGDPFWEGIGWCARQLEGKGLIAPLRELKVAHRVELVGMPSVLITHGSPRHYREGYGRHSDEAMIEEIGREFHAEVLIGSHTHIPLERRFGKRLVLNTGAVGAPFNGDPRAHYLVLESDGGSWTPHWRKVSYDRERSLRAFEERGYLAEAGLSARIFLDELRYARSLLTPFLDWVERTGVPLDEDGWQRFRRDNPERFAPTPMPARLPGQ